MAHSYEYPRPAVTVDPVILGFDPVDGVLRVLLVRRGEQPFQDHWAIPGGFVHVSDRGRQGEALEDAARRELFEETGIRAPYLEQLYTFGTPGRDPRGRVISVAYLALVRQTDHAPRAGSDAAEVRWFTVAEALAAPLAFDHHDILTLAAERVRGKVRYSPIGFNLLPERFTMGQLHRLYVAVLGRALDPHNFAKRVERELVRPGIMIKTRAVQKGQHRPAPLYCFDRRAYEKATREGFNFEI